MSKLAIRYNDQSVLEQHHIARTFKILRENSANIFKNLTIQNVQLIRKYLINNILATDMSKHFVYLKDFQQEFLEGEEKKDISKLEEKDINILTGILTHTSDFHHSAQVFEISRQWSVLVNKEFIFRRGKKGIQQTAYLKDLDKMHIYAKNEAGFIKMIVKPLWETINRFLNSQIQEQVQNLENSIVQWNALQEQAQIEEELNKKKQEENLQKSKQQVNINVKLKNLV
ncbi:hypothetical protein IMG5_191960 [Ichthyophthirius multifiliis]|uniref:PDEase domain-containing protein n=1 Tax=Ichthyophthirius multifiliis TaxID=5932 RepID=G0R4F4_ICHMU|nr:hypothetical protein IMG5_191960 [Ichthyophthirius multifiliis]EGR27655.1 hypothetical protein IMG5_191960 [Ichthyophthirius multifiliis]|eukprot:XP_004025107.1 hypothetical protein IMG5_191960 [Ichthyophthirius multifiliis]